MNIFKLDEDPIACARYHCDKHVVKMILEYAQILSTAHRVLDGAKVDSKWVIDSPRNDVLYKATHINHPSVIWARSSSKNYIWLYKLFSSVLVEYTLRYKKTHKTGRLHSILYYLPDNIKIGDKTEVPLAMPDHCKLENVVESYRNYYMIEKRNIAKWAHSETPYWFK